MNDILEREVFGCVGFGEDVFNGIPRRRYVEIEAVRVGIVSDSDLGTRGGLNDAGIERGAGLGLRSRFIEEFVCFLIDQIGKRSDSVGATITESYF